VKQAGVLQLNGHICIFTAVICKDLHKVSLPAQPIPAQSESLWKIGNFILQKFGSSHKPCL
jgi:hypothetical protein